MCFGGAGGGGSETDAQRHSQAASQEQFDWQKKVYQDDLNRSEADAAKTAAEELERQQRVEKGLGEVDKIFKPYDATTKEGRKYYKGLTSDYVSSYLPSINKQYGDAKQENLFSFARNGTIDSSAAAKATGDLETQLGEQKQALSQKGVDYANQAKLNAQDRRNALVNQVYATSDPVTVSSAGVEAGKKATQFTADPANFILPKTDYSPLAGLFTTAATVAGSALQPSYGGGTSAGLSTLFTKRTNEGRNVS